MRDLPNERVVSWRDVDDPQERSALRSEAARRALRVAQKAMQGSGKARKRHIVKRREQKLPANVRTAESMWREICSTFEIDFKKQPRLTDNDYKITTSILRQAGLSLDELEALMRFAVENWSALEQEFAWMKGGRARNGRLSAIKGFPGQPSLAFFLRMLSHMRRIKDKEELPYGDSEAEKQTRTNRARTSRNTR